MANLRRGGGRRRGRHSWPRSQPINWCRPLGIKVQYFGPHRTQISLNLFLLCILGCARASDSTCLFSWFRQHMAAISSPAGIHPVRFPDPLGKSVEEPDLYPTHPVPRVPIIHFPSMELKFLLRRPGSPQGVCTRTLPCSRTASPWSPSATGRSWW